MSVFLVVTLRNYERRKETKETTKGHGGCSPDGAQAAVAGEVCLAGGDRADAQQSRAFMDLGFRFKRTNTSRGYVVVQRSAAEIKERLHLQASDEVTL